GARSFRLRAPYTEKLPSGSSRLEHRQYARVVEVAGCNAFEMCTDTAQLGSHKTVHEMQSAIQPCKQLILDFVMNRQRDFGAIWPNLSEIYDAHKRNVSADGLECVLIWGVAVDREEHRVSLKAQRASKTEINRLRRGHSCSGNH